MSGIFAILRSTLCHVQWKVLGLFFTTKKVCELKFTAEVHEAFFDLSKWQMNYIGWKCVSFFSNLFYFLPFLVFFQCALYLLWLSNAVLYPFYHLCRTIWFFSWTRSSCKHLGRWLINVCQLARQCV